MLYGYGHLPLAKNIYLSEKKTYATEITTKCVHLISFIIAEDL